MKYIDNWFHFYPTKAGFENIRRAGFINPDSICFIRETSQIYTQNTFFGIPKEQFEQLSSKVEELAQQISKNTEKISKNSGDILLLKAKINDEIVPIIEEVSQNLATLNTDHETLKQSFDNFKESVKQDLFNLKEVRLPALEGQVTDISGILATTNTSLSNLSTDYNTFKNSKGSPNGIAPLDNFGLIPSSYLPSYVDDIEVFPSFVELPANGVPDRIYVTADTNLTYRYTGEGYVEISKSIGLGETSSTAYAGDKGKKNADDIIQLKTDLGTAKQNITNLTETSEKSVIAPNTDKYAMGALARFATGPKYIQKATATGSNIQPMYISEYGVPTVCDHTIEASVPANAKFTDTTYSPATSTANGLITKEDKAKLDGIEKGAQVNTVISVASKTGAITLNKSDVGLSNVDNTSDANKPISTATTNALNNLSNNIFSSISSIQAQIPRYINFTGKTSGSAPLENGVFNIVLNSPYMTASSIEYKLNLGLKTVNMAEVSPTNKGLVEASDLRAFLESEMGWDAYYE